MTIFFDKKVSTKSSEFSYLEENDAFAAAKLTCYHQKRTNDIDLIVRASYWQPLRPELNLTPKDDNELQTLPGGHLRRICAYEAWALK